MGQGEKYHQLSRDEKQNALQVSVTRSTIVSLTDLMSEKCSLSLFHWQTSLQ